MSEQVNKTSSEEKNKTKSIISWTATILICLIVAKLFTTFVIRSVEVDGYSMSTTLMDGDKALTDALFYKMGKINRFDIVIVKKEKGVLKGEELVKRVVGLPGETIEYKDGILYINDQVIEENFINEEVKSVTPRVYRQTLKDDQYFVLGDNRGNSLDSSEFGPINKKEITGKGLLRFMVCTKKDEMGECTKRKFIWPSKVK